jgi:hypothetical protein
MAAKPKTMPKKDMPTKAAPKPKKDVPKDMPKPKKGY